MKKLVQLVLNIVKESYKLGIKRIRYELLLDYGKEVEKVLSMLDMDSIQNVLRSTRKSPIK